MKRFVWKCPQCRRVGLVWEAKCGICAETKTTAQLVRELVGGFTDEGTELSKLYGIQRSELDNVGRLQALQDAQNRLHSQTQSARQRWPGLGVQWP